MNLIFLIIGIKSCNLLNQSPNIMKELAIIFIAIGLMLTYCCKEEDNTPETGTVTDIDGNTYKTVKIGDQWWMAVNLKVTHYRNGDSIPNYTDNTQWTTLDTIAYCNYNNDPGNVNLYGRLYNWFAVTDSRNIAPMGWHVATNDEWITLITFLGGEITAGDELDNYDFNTHPGGYRDYANGSYQGIDSWGSWWTSTEYDANSAWGVSVSTDGPWMGRGSDDKHLGSSVRCVKD
jgi:uncharacterized protein (TIGR02145 family)